MAGAMASWTRSIVGQGEAERQVERVSERALDLYQNDAMAHGVLESLLVETVGIGLTPLPSPKGEWLGFDDEWESSYQSAAMRIWEEHGLDCRHFCDAQRRLDYYALQGLKYFNWRLFGIGLGQIIAKTMKGSPLSTCVLPINPFRLVSPAGTNREIYDGIQIDKDGAPVRVWLRKPGAYQRSISASDCESFPVWDEETGLPRILLVTDVRNIAEYRQDSILGPMITEIRHSNDLANAAVVGAMVRNLYTMFINDYSQGVITKDTPWEDRVHQTEQATILFGAGKEKPTFFSHEAAPSRYQEMFGAIIDRLGMATGRGAENVARKFQASYSAAKANMEKEDQVNEFEHRTLIGQFCQPFLAWQQYEAALRGRLPVRSMKHFLDNLYAYTHTEHLAQPMRQIDRQKAAMADTLGLGSHMTTYREIHGRNGQDWKAVLRQAAAEKKYMKGLEEEFGVDMSSAKIPDAAWKTEDKPDDGKDQS
jgi:capsid protein